MSNDFVEVAADIGGTFTDVIVTTRSLGRQTIKVLSSGRLSMTVTQIEPEGTLRAQLPVRLSGDGFWVGARLMGQSASGRDVDLGTIQRWENAGPADENRSLVNVRFQLHAPPSVDDRLAVGDSLRLDSGLEAPVLATRLLLGVPLTKPLPPTRVRLGTTRGTNALLTRTGAATALLVTRGFGDLLEMGTQDRPDLFSLNILKPTPLPRVVIEVGGRLDAGGDEIEALDAPEVERQLAELRARTGPDEIASVAICLLHAHRSDVHERCVEAIARRAGFARVIRSSAEGAGPRLIPRAETTTLDAYLAPVLEDYVARVTDQFGGQSRCHLRWMTSGGNLVPSAAFRGRDSVLSGPAGGVVALADIAKTLGIAAAVGLDMGGTSTDVSRLDGVIGRRQESTIGGIRVQAPMMDIHTIAAGGGSICCVRDGRLFVGPESAGAEPGPACYGRGGPLTITDVNLLLGRLNADRFPFPLDRDAAQSALRQLHQSLPTPQELSELELAAGFLRIAVTQMAEAVRVVTTSAGSDVRTMTLVGFGGAAGGHLCQIAAALGIERIVDHPEAGLLSALGIGAAPLGRIVSRSVEQAIAPEKVDGGTRSWLPDAEAAIRLACQACQADAAEQLRGEATADTGQLESTMSVDVRYAKTQSPLTLDAEPLATLPGRFDQRHAKTFGYDRPTMAIEIVAVRCEATLATPPHSTVPTGGSPRFDAGTATFASMGGAISGWAAWDRETLPLGHPVTGPAVISGPHSVLVVDPGWTATADNQGWIVVTPQLSEKKPSSATKPSLADDNDAIAMEVVTRRVQGIAESMGEVIRRTSVSVNVKERRDYSCAVFLGDGSLVANAAHVPVHLGAMGHTVRRLIEAFPVMHPGDVYLSNDPFAGGSHLPDVTTVTPVFCDSGATTFPPDRPCDFFVASRCHHAEIGGIVPGSMAPAATSLAQEGVLIRNFALVRERVEHYDALRRLLTQSPYPTRNVAENLADIAAAEAAGCTGATAMVELAGETGLGRLRDLLQRLLHVAGEATATWIASLGKATRTFADSLDDGTPVAVTLMPDTAAGRLRIDFAGTGGVHPHGFNATRSIVTAAVLYTLRCVSASDLPLCDGVLRRIDLVIPPGLLDPPASDDPWQCPAVVAGNVETSNRVVDVLLGALDVAAASQGTMNNLLIGDESFGYYETIGGGSGATGTASGASAVHTHMTNTRITDPEIFESRYPLRLVRWSIRRGSGGRGQHCGGDGMIREIEFLRPLTVSLITSRRTTRPYGRHGGEAGQSGRQTWISRDGSSQSLPSCLTIEVAVGDRLQIETPGGGGWGVNELAASRNVT